MTTTTAPSRNFLRSKAHLLRVGIFIAIATLSIFSLLTVSSASRSEKNSAKGKEVLSSSGVAPKVEAKAANLNLSLANNGLVPFAFMPQAGDETVAIYETDCTTPKTDFTLGQTLCAKLTNAPLGSRPTQIQRRLSIVGPDGYIRSESDVSALSSTATLSFTIPATATSVVGGDTVDNRGSWQAISMSTRDGSVQAKAGFQVTDSNPLVKVADVGLQSAVEGSGELAPNENVTFTVYLANLGPDPAEDVAVTDDVPADTTFVSAVSSDANFTCAGVSLGGTGTTTCSAASLAAGDEVKFEMTFKVNSGTALKTIITNIAEVTTTTPQRSTRDDMTEAVAAVTDAEAASNCQLTCPADVIVTVSPTSSGTTVKFGAAAGIGECGAITNSPASGSFFTVGEHTITSTSEAGPSCTFKVKVLNTPAPTISCPSNKIATAGVDGTANVSTGTPTFTPTDGTLAAVRTDARPAVIDENGVETTPAFNPLVTDPYPTGITGITWTVTDADGRTASCRQTVTVNAVCADDTESPTITAPDDVTVFTGQDNTGCRLALDDELGQADAHDNCNVTVTITGIPAGNEFPIGTTTLTYTATDAAGNPAATDTQTVTVIDNTPPRIAAPPDATYTCRSEVPAANVNQATRGVVLDEDGNPLPPGPPFDNCGTPTVTVTETSSGAGSAASPLIITRTFTATDGAAVPNSSSAVQVITVIDPTPPTITAPADVTLYTGPGATSCGVTVSDLNASLGVAIADDNCDGETVARSGVPAGNTFPLGNTTVTYTATDASGNTASDTQVVTVVDNTPPVVTPPANITVFLPLNSTATSMAVSYPNPATATDNCPGTITFVYSPASGSTFSVGTSTVTVTATDAHNNSAQATFTVTVLYNFTGFDSPVSNIPVVNNVNAGRSIPLKFSLSGNKGLNIFAAGYPASQQVTCNSSAPLSELEGTETPGGSTLSYSPDKYHYNWKTESSWAGTCRQLVVKLNDGSEHIALFKFK